MKMNVLSTWCRPCIATVAVALQVIHHYKQYHDHQRSIPRLYFVFAAAVCSVCLAQLSKQQHLSLAWLPPLSKSIDMLFCIVLVRPQVCAWNQNELIPITYRLKKKQTDVGSQADWAAASHHFFLSIANGKRPCEAFNHWSAEESHFSSLPSHKLPCHLFIIAPALRLTSQFKAFAEKCLPSMVIASSADEVKRMTKQL